MTEKQGNSPIPVSECHHDVKGREEQHEVEERIGIGDAILLIIHCSVGAAALLKAVGLRPFIDQRWLVTSKGQFADFVVGRVPNTEIQRERKPVWDIGTQTGVFMFGYWFVRNTK